MASDNGQTFAGAMVHAPLAKAAPYAASQAFEPRGIEEAMRLARLLVASRLLPRSVATPEAAFAIIATGRELGMTAMQSLRSIHVIEGKPTLSADLVAALVKSRTDVCRYFMLVASTPQVATYETQRVGDPKPTTMSFSMEDATRAGLQGKDNWRKYPAAMLRARCITALARAVYPDLAMGIYDADELEPAPVPEAQRWVEPVPDDAPCLDQHAAWSAFCERVDMAEQSAALNGIARDATKAHKQGLITDGHLEHLKEAVTRRRAAFGAPSPPKSEPRVEDAEVST